MLGAAIADLSAGRKIGKRAMIYGAVLGTLPDIDVAAGIFMNDLDKIIFHRGVTHSLLFWLVMSPLCGWIISRFEAGRGITLIRASAVSFLIFSSHALIDSFTSYGTRLLIPVSSEAFAFSTISIIDPFYSIWLWITIPWVFIRRLAYHERRKILMVALIASHVYLVGTLINKVYVNTQFEQLFARQQEDVIRFYSKPGLFSNLLWRGIAETENGFYVAHFAQLAGTQQVEVTYEHKRHHHIDHIRDTRAIMRLADVTDGYFSVEQKNDILIVNDLRFGRISEWSQSNSPYAFSYKITDDRKGVDIQRVPVRFEGERDRKMVKNLLKRILGKRITEP